MTNPFLEAIYHKFTYECNGKTIVLTNEETSHENGKYFCVKCDKCCNVPVLHLLRKQDNRVH
jgi:hypothetical protein